MQKQQIQIRIKTVTKEINTYTNYIKKILTKLKINFTTVYLPIKIKKITLLKSPHVNKKAREQFQLKKYKTCINICAEKINNILFKLLILNKPKYIKLNLRKII